MRHGEQSMQWLKINDGTAKPAPMCIDHVDVHTSRGLFVFIF
jgi:hypothetical protein